MTGLDSIHFRGYTPNGRYEVHDGYLRCLHCTRRRWWLLTHAFNPAEVAVTAMLEQHAADNDAL